MKYDKDKMYEPCPCGSGKKFKFCCYGKSDVSAHHPVVPFLALDPDAEAAADEMLWQAERLTQQGKRLMDKHLFREAIPSLRRAIETCPFFPPAINNLALCLYVEGDIDEAIRVQTEGIEGSPIPNVFGLCQLAQFLWIIGDEAEGASRLNASMGQPHLNIDATIKQCEALARFGRHQDILAIMDSEYAPAEDLGLFLGGVAAANLGLVDRARGYLRRISGAFPKGKLVRTYLSWLNENSPPKTVLGDWPYFEVNEIVMYTILQKISRRAEKQEAAMEQFRAGPLMTEVVIAMLNAGQGDIPSSLDQLAKSKHAKTNTLLWAIVKGTFGPDELRIKAVQILQERQEISPQKATPLWINGAWTEIRSMGCRTNPDIHYGKLPDAWVSDFERAIQLLGSGKHRQAETALRKIIRHVPDFYPAEYNLAVCLLHMYFDNEAELLLRKVAMNHPHYLFAPAALLQLLIRQKRDQEAQVLVSQVVFPPEAHPAALASWLASVVDFEIGQGRCDTAGQLLDMLKSVDPGNPFLSALAARLQKEKSAMKDDR